MGCPRVLASEPDHQRRRSAILRRLLVASLCLLLLFSGRWAWRIYRHAQSLRQHAAQLASQIPAQLDQVAPTLNAMQADLTALGRSLRVPLWCAVRLGWLPRYGPTLKAAPILFATGERLLDASVGVWAAMQAPLITCSREQGCSDTLYPDLIDGLGENAGDLTEASAQLRLALADLAEIQPGDLISPLSTPVVTLQSLTPLISAALSSLPVIPDLLDNTDEATILILAQNSDELRPTGGFISAIGTLSLRREGMELGPFLDSYRVEDWTVAHPDPPEPLRDQMKLDLWVTRDANWWPDFPTSAQAVADLYELNQGTRVDGVVAFDTQSAIRLLEALSPPGLPQGDRLEAGEIQEAFRSSWGLPAESLITAGEIVTASQRIVGIELSLAYGDRGGRAWFDSVELVPLDGEANLVRNPSFEIDIDRDGMPDDWVAAGMTLGDGLVNDVAHSGNRSLRMLGTQSIKAISQRIDHVAEAGQAFRVSAQSQAVDAAVRGGPYALQVTFLYPQGQANKILEFPGLTHGWASAGSNTILAHWWRHRKDFMNVALQAALGKISQDLAPADALRLGGIMADLLDERHIQAWFADPELQQVVREQGWDGALSQEPGDTLMVVDSNVGYNKVSASIHQSLRYAVAIDSQGRAEAHLTIHYVNESQPNEAECDRFRQYVPTYDLLTEGCYWDYVRVYVPLGSELLPRQGEGTSWAVSTENDRTVFSTAFVLPRGALRDLEVRYLLPPSVIYDGHYTLHVHKQAGTNALPLEVVCTIANTFSYLGTSPEPTELDASGKVVWRTDLLLDRNLSVQYSR